ncbi:acyltransferase ChoActase/COT/CPT [Trametes meyenii]|nr:acyltransferase ChoActase/COT/CPT [Trametes meyenii]
MQSPHLVSSQTRAASRTTSPSLPRLPVPDLHKTLQKYLKSLEPILLEAEKRWGQDFKSAYDARVKLVHDFEHDLGPLCQDRLLALDKKSPNNWLDDNIWLKKAYHEWRTPLIINSNWWLALGDDSTVPPSVRHRSESLTSYTAWQIRRAAWLVHRTLLFKARLEQQEIYPDTSRTGTHLPGSSSQCLWFRHAALQVFNICRIPQRGCDIFSPLPPLTDVDSRRVVVAVADWIYAIDAVAPDGTPFPADVIEKRLRAVTSDAQTRLCRGEHPAPIGVLTADDRDRWADNLTHLLSLSPTNQSIFRTITASAFALSLDAHSYALPASQHTPDPDLTAHLHNVRSGHSARPGYNRWYDKPFTLIVEANTRAGVLGEHSPVDALVPSIIADYAIVQEVDEDAFADRLGDESASVVPLCSDVEPERVGGWERLDWVTDDKIAAECEAAARRAKAIVDDSDNDELVFDTYGVDWIKSEARLSPDAYIQMALQLAWYRTCGEFTATYETALTRLYKHGRTETVRTLSADSRAWVLAMVDASVSNDARLELLRRAVQTHTQLTREAATGRGIDRHLLGLRLMLQADVGERHALFDDEFFAKSQEWKLSTSGLSAGYQFRGTGFGASFDDGYGINYMPAPDNIRFGVESKHSCPRTNTQLFMSAISDALQDMRALCTPPLLSHL